ncbi:type II toxin-antitoxin system VapC family toxin [Endothiovibrio diazotrophicus]
MKLLLDTHVWLWMIASPERIDGEAVALMENCANTLHLSAASSWEMAIKYRLGKLPLPEAPETFVPPRLSRDGVVPLPVEHAHALKVASLPVHHADPFDRLLIAQAQCEGLTLVTHDRLLMPYDVAMVWA